MRAEVVIVGFRNAEEIRDCLLALDRSTYADFGVHICENGGDAAYAALCEAVASISDGLTAGQPEGRVIARHAAALKGSGREIRLHQANGNIGYAAGINVCLEAIIADGRYQFVWILNPDTIPEPDAMTALAAHQQKGNYGIVGARLVLKGQGKIQLYGARWRPWIARGYNIGLGAPADATPDVAAIEREMDYVAGAAMFVPRAFVEQVGFFDERYFLYYEETDWCFRRGDFRLGYAHEAIVVHAHGSTIGSSVVRKTRSPLAVYLDERNKLLFSRKFLPGHYPVVLIATLLLIGQYPKAGAWRNFRVALAGWWAGVRGETGVPDRFKPKA
ncbi:glycosyltransferase family 2 protein [Flavisphingomonas formosensis]|uniref:glycosyltransferase family 2 protein n=1 Tax=Flavisphingomonas formosensis TaxID=861534 RepID=UPI0012FBDD20|nr:glycosyltransferase family 2 protein [Sphingomonas formosensis]